MFSNMLCSLFFQVRAACTKDGNINRALSRPTRHEFPIKTIAKKVE